MEYLKGSFTAYDRRWLLIFLTTVMPFLLLPTHALSASAPMAPCETLEIRVAANSGDELTFKEGVGAIFSVGSENKRKYILTVAHLIAYQKASIGICNDKVYDLKPIAVDTSIDTAVLEITNPDADVGRLFNYQKGQSPQIFELDKFKAEHGPQTWGLDAYSFLLADRSLYIETIGHRKVLLSKNNDGKLALDSIQTNLIPGSDYIYLLQLAGSKPGMSGSPVFLNSSRHSQSATDFAAEPIMVGIISKTKINDTKTALVPFNIIYKNLDLLLSGHSNTTIYTSNNTLYVNGKVYQNIGAGDFKNSADEVEFSEEIQRQFSIKDKSSTSTIDFEYGSSSDDKKALEKILKDPNKIPKSKRQNKDRPGSDWGDGGGDLFSGTDSKNFVTTATRSIFIDPTLRENSGVVDSTGMAYFGILKDGQFTQVKSIFSILKYSRNNLEDVLKKNGITNRAKAFQALCTSPAWQQQDSTIYYNKEDNVLNDGLLYSMPPYSNERNSSLYRNIYAYCTNNTLEVVIDSFNLKARLFIDAEFVSGNIKFLGCSNKIKVSSKNIWERPLNAESFTGKLEIGDSKESLIKLDIFKVHRNCNPTSNVADLIPLLERAWRTDSVFGIVNLWAK